jgi:hypothetical protein
MASSVNNRDPEAASGHPTDNISPRSVLNYSSSSRRSFTGSCNSINITCAAESCVIPGQVAHDLILRIVGVIIRHRDFVLFSEVQRLQRFPRKCNPRYLNELTLSFNKPVSKTTQNLRTYLSHLSYAKLLGRKEGVEANLYSFLT